jgi:hypothetical protein
LAENLGASASARVFFFLFALPLVAFFLAAVFAFLTTGFFLDAYALLLEAFFFALTFF